MMPMKDKTINHEFLCARKKKPEVSREKESEGKSTRDDLFIVFFVVVVVVVVLIMIPVTLTATTMR